MSTETTERTVVVPARFNGPPESVTGGYACGVFAALAAHPGPAVTLMRPPPLDAVLTARPGPRRTLILHGDDLVATVAAGGPARSPAPEPVSPEVAASTAGDYYGGTGHPAPTCFACGTDRPDGLALRPGPVPGRPGTVACLWTPDPAFTRPDGAVEPAVVWSALDCPGGWTGDLRARMMLLTRMTAAGADTVPAGRTYVIVGARVRDAGRTAVNATGLYTTGGRLVASADAVWTAVDAAATPAATPVHG